MITSLEVNDIARREVFRFVAHQNAATNSEGHGSLQTIPGAVFTHRSTNGST